MVRYMPPHIESPGESRGYTRHHRPPTPRYAPSPDGTPPPPVARWVWILVLTVALLCLATAAVMGVSGPL